MVDGLEEGVHERLMYESSRLSSLVSLEKPWMTWLADRTVIG